MGIESFHLFLIPDLKKNDLPQKKKKKHIFILLLKMIWNGKGGPLLSPSNLDGDKRRRGQHLAVLLLCC